MFAGDVLDVCSNEILHFFFDKGQILDEGIVLILVIVVDLGGDEQGIGVNVYLSGTVFFDNK